MLPFLYPFALIQRALLTQQRWARHGWRWLSEAAPQQVPVRVQVQTRPSQSVQQQRAR
jgi:hypothetical protein